MDHGQTKLSFPTPEPAQNVNMHGFTTMLDALFGGASSLLQPISNVQEKKPMVAVAENTERMVVDESNVFSMFYLAAANGYTGDIRAFIDDLNVGRPIIVEQTVEPSPRPALAQAQLAAREAMNGPIEVPEAIARSADPATLQEYISKSMIPEFTRGINELPTRFEGIDLLRQQRRMSDRLNKLMSYVAKPERIVEEAIHDEHELAIFKCYMAKQVVAGNQNMAHGEARIKAATEAMATRNGVVLANAEKQKKENVRVELLAKLQGEITQLAKDVTKMELSVAAAQLRKLLAQVEPAPVVLAEPTKAPDRIKELLVNGPRPVVSSPFAGLTEEDRRELIKEFGQFTQGHKPNLCCGMSLGIDNFQAGMMDSQLNQPRTQE